MPKAFHIQFDRTQLIRLVRIGEACNSRLIVENPSRLAILLYGMHVSNANIVTVHLL